VNKILVFLDVSVRELLHLIFDAGSVTCKTEFYESKDWDIKKGFSDAKTLVKVMHRKLVFVKSLKYLKAFI